MEEDIAIAPRHVNETLAQDRGNPRLDVAHAGTVCGGDLLLYVCNDHAYRSTQHPRQSK